MLSNASKDNSNCACITSHKVHHKRRLPFCTRSPETEKAAILHKVTTDSCRSTPLKGIALARDCALPAAICFYFYNNKVR